MSSGLGVTDNATGRGTQTALTRVSREGEESPVGGQERLRTDRLAHSWGWDGDTPHSPRPFTPGNTVAALTRVSIDRITVRVRWYNSQSEHARERMTLSSPTHGQSLVGWRSPSQLPWLLSRREHRGATRGSPEPITGSQSWAWRRPCQLRGLLAASPCLRHARWSYSCRHRVQNLP